jgi:hypothetical protein
MGGAGGKGGGTSSTSTSTVNVNNSGTTTLDIVGLDNIDVRTELVLPQPFTTEQVLDLRLPQPLRTENRNEIAVTEPIVTDNRNQMEVDIKPLVLDLCLNLNVGKPPAMTIRQPQNVHFGFTLFGMEIFGFSFTGESQTIIESPDPKPKVIWGGEEKTKTSHKPHHSTAESGGLRIRLKD